MLRSMIVVATMLVCMTSAAHARNHRHHRAVTSCVETGGVMRPSCMGASNPFSGARSVTVKMRRVRSTASSGEIVSHPDGCPRSAFCGCGASVKVYGHPVRGLFAAASWYRFPRSAPAPGMAAVRPHHVMVLESHVSGDVWQVYDANSGGHLTRRHERSIAGWAIVDPKA